MSKAQPKIEIRGAYEHNLKGIDLTIDRGAVTVITGVSGSGKSSLAFDTILAESQRRFFYTLSHYSRQFLDLQSRPAVRQLSGLSPAISLAQNETQPSRRATVGTLTDVSELISVLFARFGDKHCPKHQLPTSSLTPDEIVANLFTERSGKTIAITTPIAAAKKGIFKTQLAGFAAKGYLRAFIDDGIVALSPTPVLQREEKHTIKLIIDYVKVKPESSARLKRSIEAALLEGGGFGEIFEANAKGKLDLETMQTFSSTDGCPVCGFSWPRLDSRYFSANSLGRCEECFGLGFLTPGADSEETEVVEEAYLLDRTSQREVCITCGGTGLDARYETITLAGKSPRAIHSMPIDVLRVFINKLSCGPLGENPAFMRVFEEVEPALRRIDEVGLAYLHIARRVRSLSSGEAQRLKLAGILGENLRGVLYVLDEPSQGLHPSELELIWEALARLRDAGNTIIIVDHDETFMRKADWIVDLGPGGGARGGRLLAKFRPAEAPRFARLSSTARHLAKPQHTQPRPGQKSVQNALVIRGASLHNLAVDEARFPLGGMTVVTGVSGAGKSSLVLGTLYPNLVRLLAATSKKTGAKVSRQPIHCQAFEAAAEVLALSLIDRRPVAKSSVSMPASYLGVFTDIRDLYASLPEAQVAGLTARSFSLSVEGGRCLECKGRGEISLSMKFLADARVRCPVCKGKRYRPQVQSLLYLGLAIGEVLELTLDEVVEHFKNHRKIVRKLMPAVELGLGYLKLGQPSASLSGGEAQRLKIVPHLVKRHGDGSVLILDEPTTGLHFEDVERLIVILRKLVEAGATVVIIEHNAWMVNEADWVIDLGPHSAGGGGKLCYQGTPAGLAKAKNSITAKYL